MRTAPAPEESKTPGLEVGAEPPPASRGFARRTGAFLLREFFEILPPTIFFFIGFNLIVLTTNLILANYRVRFASFMLATAAALIVAKALLVANALPVIRRYDRAPLIRPILFKTACYSVAVFIARLLEHWIEYMFIRGYVFGGFLKQEIVVFSWDRFIAIQLWILVLFLIYVTASEFNRLFGEGELWHLLFTSRPSDLPLDRRQRIRELIRLSKIADAHSVDEFSDPKSAAHSQLVEIVRRLAAEPHVRAPRHDKDRCAPAEHPRTAASRPDFADMIWLPGGTSRMGSDKHYAEETPVHRVKVDGFWIDRTPVTNRQFREFVRATCRVTIAEIAPDLKDYAGALPNMLKPGSLVFNPSKHAVDLTAWSQRWTFKFGADWTSYGLRSSFKGRNEHPVVHVAYSDALAYAKWAGKDVSTEAEWEFAARGGLDSAEFAWGDEFTPGGRYMANTWQGPFPHENLKLDGYARTSLVAVFPQNGYGLYDMIGNVWEWTTDWCSPGHEADAENSCCIPINPRGGDKDASYDSRQPTIKILRKVLKGGSHLVRQITAAVIAPQRAIRSRLTPRSGVSASAASFVKREHRHDHTNGEYANPPLRVHP